MGFSSNDSSVSDPLQSRSGLFHSFDVTVSPNQSWQLSFAETEGSILECLLILGDILKEAEVSEARSPHSPDWTLGRYRALLFLLLLYRLGCPILELCC